VRSKRIENRKVEIFSSAVLIWEDSTRAGILPYHQKAQKKTRLPTLGRNETLHGQRSRGLGGPYAVMMNGHDSKWVVLLTRSHYLGDSEVIDGSYLADRDTQAIFVGSLQECFSYCKAYANHEAGWERLDSAILRLRREYRADIFSKEKAGVYDREITDVLSLQMIPG
jgi:hypothetical protein